MMTKNDELQSIRWDMMFKLDDAISAYDKNPSREAKKKVLFYESEIDLIEYLIKHQQ